MIDKETFEYNTRDKAKFSVLDLGTAAFNEATSAETALAVNPAYQSTLDEIAALRKAREDNKRGIDGQPRLASPAGMHIARIPAAFTGLLFSRGEKWLNSPEFDKWLDAHPEWRTYNKRRLA